MAIINKGIHRIFIVVTMLSIIPLWNEVGHSGNYSLTDVGTQKAVIETAILTGAVYISLRIAYWAASWVIDGFRSGSE